MKGTLNPKITGAIIIGFSLVAGAYTISNLTKPMPVIQTANVSSTNSLQRVAIEVADKDGDGIEDWRDEFITAQPVILNQASSTYIAPETVTGQMSIYFMENIIRSRGYGPFGQSEEEVIAETVNTLAREAVDKLYDVPDITIMSTWDDEDIRNYANTVAATIYRHNIPELDYELYILRDIVTNGNHDRLSELVSLANVYRSYRDDTLKIPVPTFLAKQHLDLINTYHAIYRDIESMTLALEDPAVSLVRLKRYEDDAAGLGYALQNMFLTLEPYADLFTVEDPAVLFVVFSPDYQM